MHGQRVGHAAPIERNAHVLEGKTAYIKIEFAFYNFPWGLFRVCKNFLTILNFSFVPISRLRKHWSHLKGSQAIMGLLDAVGAELDDHRAGEGARGVLGAHVLHELAHVDVGPLAKHASLRPLFDLVDREMRHILDASRFPPVVVQLLDQRAAHGLGKSLNGMDILK